MEDPNSTLLPYILEALSRKPDLCDAFDQLCDDVEKQLNCEQNSNSANVRKAIQRAVNVGQSLGIITVTEEMVRAPFNFCAKSGKAPPSPSIMMWQAHTQPQPEIGTGNPLPSRSVVVTSNVTASPTGAANANAASNAMATAVAAKSGKISPITKVPSKSKPLRPTARAKSRSKSRAKLKTKSKTKARSRSVLNRARKSTRGRAPLRRKRNMSRKRLRGRVKSRKQSTGRPRYR